MLVLIATAAHAQTDLRNPYLVQAEAFYQGAEFEKCVERTEQGMRSASTASDKVSLEIYAGLCLQNLDREKAARAHFTAALKLDINAQLPPLASPKSKELLDQLRATLSAEHANDVPDATGPQPQMLVLTPAQADVATGSTARAATLSLGVAAGVAAVLSITLGITSFQEGDIGFVTQAASCRRCRPSLRNRAATPIAARGSARGLATAAAIAALLTAVLSRL